MNENLTEILVTGGRVLKSSYFIQNDETEETRKLEVVVLHVSDIQGTEYALIFEGPAAVMLGKHMIEDGESLEGFVAQAPDIFTAIEEG